MCESSPSSDQVNRIMRYFMRSINDSGSKQTLWWKVGAVSGSVMTSPLRKLIAAIFLNVHC